MRPVFVLDGIVPVVKSKTVNMRRAAMGRLFPKGQSRRDGVLFDEVKTKHTYSCNFFLNIFFVLIWLHSHTSFWGYFSAKNC